MPEIADLLAYCPITGRLTWKTKRGPRSAGSIAGSVHEKGYIRVNVCGRLHYAHRLAWLLAHGRWPKGQIDHINGIRTDNRLANLREATPTNNNGNRRVQSNTRSGVKGAHWHKQSGKWTANIRIDGRQIYLGLFATAKEAGAAYAEAAKTIFGEFARQ